VLLVVLVERTILPLDVSKRKALFRESQHTENMDTMLVPVTKFVGAELGLVALITGV